MNFFNVDSQIEITAFDMVFINQVFHAAKNSSTWNPEISLTEYLKIVPVFLLSDNSMQKFDYVIRKSEDPDRNPSTEYLGFYKRLTDITESIPYIPAIFICPERIWKSINKPFNKNKINYQELLTKVIIHEFAHAKMDTGRNDKFPDYSEEFYRYVEEPLANWFVLKYLYHYGNGHFFNVAKEFINSQPDEYKKGVDLFENSIPDNCWKNWLELKKTEINKKDKVDYMNGIKSKAFKDFTESFKKLCSVPK